MEAPNIADELEKDHYSDAQYVPEKRSILQAINGDCGDSTLLPLFPTFSVNLIDFHSMYQRQTLCYVMIGVCQILVLLFYAPDIMFKVLEFSQKYTLRGT